MNICVVGAGAIGGWVAAKLARSGAEVMALISRGPLDEIMISEDVETQRIAFRQFEGPADLLILAVKAPALPAVAPTLAPLIGPHTSILPMLNGVPWWFIDGEPLQSIDPGG